MPAKSHVSTLFPLKFRKIEVKFTFNNIELKLLHVLVNPNTDKNSSSLPITIKYCTEIFHNLDLAIITNVAASQVVLKSKVKSDK